jgi:PAS domain S-box-containing protein
MSDKGETNMAIVQDITERKGAEEAVATIVKQLGGDSSEAFFSSMASNLAKCLSAEHTIIGELVEREDKAVKTIAVCSHGSITDNFTYRLANTPSASLANQGTCSYASGVCRIFPHDPLLSEMKVEGYVGTPLFGAQGTAIGIMVALYSRPLDNPGHAEMILQLFSARTGAEIEHRRTEKALRQSEERLRVSVQNSGVIVCHQDRDLRYTWLRNPRLDWAEQNVIGKTDSEIIGAEAASSLNEIKGGVLQSGVGTRREVQISDGDKQHYFDLSVEPVTDSTGSVTGVTCAAMDITSFREINEELRRAKEKLIEEKFYLEQEIDTELGFKEIVGTSEPLKRVMESVARVATSDSTVLLLGETGTGKELIARAVHRMSKRSDHGFIKMNCAAIPEGLLESDLFGHERGAFTGAVSRKIGRLELSDKGTLFLDEIGEIPLTLQPKLLRVLQDHEFERLGGTKTLKVNFRLIAATNRDLLQDVQEKRFRSDLYYRLNVFPVLIPPLRERRGDIPLLVEHFVRKHAQHMNKPITSIPKTIMDALMDWGWPGNVRELENFMERSVILTHGSVLVCPISELSEGTVAGKSLEMVGQEHILPAFKESSRH